MLRRFAAVALLVTLSSPGSFAGEPTSLQDEAPRPQRTRLRLGDPAPPLTIDDWVTGAPVTSFEPGRVYVVEFWATWCGLCLATIPHLTEIQSEHRDQDLTVIGVTSRDPHNTLDKVQKLVSEMGNGIGYTIAWDQDRRTNDDWMTAADQKGIPCSFLVDQEGRIAYIGHPMWLDIPLEGVLAGTWDLESGTRQIDYARKRLDHIYRTAKKGDPDAALAQLDEFSGAHPGLSSSLGEFRFELFLRCGEWARASEVGRKLVDDAIASRNAMTLNRVAWTIVDPDRKWAQRDLELSFRAATQACELTHFEDAAILDTLARVHFWEGNLAKAIELQEMAVRFTSDALREQIEAALREYYRARDRK